MKGIPLPQRSDAELEAIHRAQHNAYQRQRRGRWLAVERFRAAVVEAAALLPGMPIEAEERLIAAIERFDKEMMV